MTTPRPASAPPVDSLHEALRGLLYMWRTSEKNGERVTQFDKGYEQASDECADALETVLNSIAASAQVRAAGKVTDNYCDKCGYYYRDGVMCRCAAGITAAEPVPVAQGELIAQLRRENWDDAADLIEQQQATISDHARRESDLQRDLRMATTRADMWLRSAADEKTARMAVEASLAACRADADAAWIAAIDEAHQQTDAGLCIGYRAADRVKRRAREIIAAIDAALRQEAP